MYRLTKKKIKIFGIWNFMYCLTTSSITCLLSHASQVSVVSLSCCIYNRSLVCDVINSSDIVSPIMLDLKLKQICEV